MAGSIQRPLLPPVAPSTVPSLFTWLPGFLRAMNDWVDQVVRRLNASLPNDGSESATAILLSERTVPADPADGTAIFYVDSATGDLMAKITHGGVTKVGTVLDYSTL